MTGQATVVSDDRDEPPPKRRKSMMTSARPAKSDSVMQGHLEGEDQGALQKTSIYLGTRMGGIHVVKSGFQ